jgi:hypothetical protein
VRQSGGDFVMLGWGGQHLIRPPDERWNLALLERQSSVESFWSFASNDETAAGIGHQAVAMKNFRLLPLVEDA